MLRTLALIAGVAAAGLLAQTAAHAARQELAASSGAADLLQGPEAHAQKAAPRTPAFHGLMGAAEAEVSGRLGKPEVSRAEGAGAMWTYRLPDCALFVFFRRSGTEGLKVSAVAAGPRSRGRNPPPVNECVTEGFGRHAAEAPGPVR